MSEKNIPTDGTASQGAYEAFKKVFGEEMVYGWGIFLESGWTPEVICSYAIGHIPENAYNLMLSAVRYAEIKLKAEGPRCLHCSYLSGQIYKLCDNCLAFVERAKAHAGARV